MDDFSSSVGTNSTESKYVPGYLILQLLYFLAREQINPSTKETVNSEYDYIIVGAGAAGSALASRLSELPCVSVLLLEAGGDAPLLTDVPSYSRFFYESEVDWKYKTVPQQYAAFGHKDNRVTLNSGKVLGGTTVINGMLHVRGNRHNYEDWVKLGADGWGYAEMLPYFMKLEDNRNIATVDAGYHGLGGPMTTTRPEYYPEIKQPVFDATAQFGYTQVDSNGRRQTGMYNYQTSYRNGRRCSTSKAYLVPAQNRPNLDIVKNAFVTKVVFQGLDAVGVLFHYKGQFQAVNARREVILSAGAIRTPQLLMLSGIGPENHLAQFGIPCIANAPVGLNYQDHFGGEVLFAMSENITPVVVQDILPDSINEYIQEQRGPLTGPFQIGPFGWFNGLYNSPEKPDFPKQQIYWYEFGPESLKEVLRPDVYEAKLKPYEGKSMYRCRVFLTQPESRGSVTLNSTNPFEYPLINPNYYESYQDMQTVVEGMKICKIIGATEPMKRIQSSPVTTAYPGCEKYVGNDDLFFECEARTNLYTEWHIVGTARMGQPGPDTVVDTDLRVVGVNRLRVVDASVIPRVTSGNTHVPVIAIAEKIADRIKRELYYCENYF